MNHPNKIDSQKSDFLDLLEQGTPLWNEIHKVSIELMDTICKSGAVAILRLLLPFTTGKKMVAKASMIDRSNDLQNVMQNDSAYAHSACDLHAHKNGLFNDWPWLARLTRPFRSRVRVQAYFCSRVRLRSRVWAHFVPGFGLSLSAPTVSASFRGHSLYLIALHACVCKYWLGPCCTALGSDVRWHQIYTCTVHIESRSWSQAQLFSCLLHANAGCGTGNEASRPTCGKLCLQTNMFTCLTMQSDCCHQISSHWISAKWSMACQACRFST